MKVSIAKFLMFLTLVTMIANCGKEDKVEDKAVVDEKKSDFIITSPETMSLLATIKIEWKEYGEDYFSLSKDDGVKYDLDISSDKECEKIDKSFKDLKKTSKVVTIDVGNYYVCLSAKLGDKKKKAENSPLELVVKLPLKSEVPSKEEGDDDDYEDDDENTTAVSVPTEDGQVTTGESTSAVPEPTPTAVAECVLAQCQDRVEYVDIDPDFEDLVGGVATNAPSVSSWIAPGFSTWTSEVGDWNNFKLGALKWKINHGNTDYYAYVFKDKIILDLSDLGYSMLVFYSKNHSNFIGRAWQSAKQSFSAETVTDLREFY